MSRTRFVITMMTAPPAQVWPGAVGVGGNYAREASAREAEILTSALRPEVRISASRAGSSCDGNTLVTPYRRLKVLPCTWPFSLEIVPVVFARWPRGGDLHGDALQPEGVQSRRHLRNSHFEPRPSVS